ncbi:DUF29 family protein [Benzoatithermus flavus]|uniref:DUF29 family protein n=1 Tax=Benzoatithermus flavus TaxID=3108223 RepID=A0ABU8XRB3_9PROT
MSTLYERDFYSWTQQQAEILRRAGEQHLNAPAGLDWEHVAEEIEQLGKDELDELYSRYAVLIAHDTGMPTESLPAICPSTLEQVEDQAFWPEPEEGRP